MKTIVITGSTRGIGLGLANEFLIRGNQVIINGRSEDSVKNAVEELSSKYGPERVAGYACDMGYYEEVKKLWHYAKKMFVNIDIWINNAGISHESKEFLSISPDIIKNVIQTNLIGVVNGIQVAYKHMNEQGYGFIYNMEGFGSDGRTTPGLSIYGTSKRAMTYLTKAVINEMDESPIKMGYLSPGMVVTELLIGDTNREGEKWERQKRIFNILADRVETVTPYLVEQILKNTKHGAKIAWLTTPKIIFRFLSAPFIKRNIV